MNAAKIQLSSEELTLVQNAGWLLTKNKIIEKVFALFGQKAHALRAHITTIPNGLDAAVLTTSPKISRGENYKGLPWVMLDYPRLFGKADVFAMRTMFWWGHFFSVTLHLKGQYKRQFQSHVLHRLPLLAANDFFICVGDDEWRHEFDEDNYLPVNQMNISAVEKILLANDFCKLSAKISLLQWNQSEQLLDGLYETIFTTFEH